MLSPAEMRKLRIFVMERDMDRAARALGRLGVVHLRSSVEESEGQLDPEATEEQVQSCRHLRERLGGLMQRLGIEQPVGPNLAPESGPGVEQVQELVESLEEKVATETGQLEEARQALADTEEILQELAPYEEVGGSLRRVGESAFLAMKAGTASHSSIDQMQSAMPDGVLMVPLGAAEAGEPGELLVLSSRRRRHAMQTVLDDHEFEEKSLPAWGEKSPSDIYREAAEGRRRLRETIGRLQAELRAIGEPYVESLGAASRALDTQLRLYEAEQNFGSTWSTAVISGWIPAGREEDVRAAVREVAGDRALIEIARPDREEIEQGRVPSYVAHSRLLAPFQQMVQGYGVASYTEIEPTVLFAASFLLMFGVIFGDLGHGLCLLVGGLLVHRWSRKPEVRDVAYVVAAAGLASMVSGTFFQGSFFGKSLADAGFPLTLGFEPIRFEGEGAGASRHVVRYLILAVVLGMVLISLGGVLNIVNRLRRGDYEGGLLGRFGLVGIIFYWGAIAFAVKLLLAGAGASDRWMVGGLVLLPLVLIVLHRPLCALLTHRRPLWGESSLFGFLEGLIEALETVMVYLANTFSFLRVAAFALSHAALCFTILVLQRLVNGLPGGLLWSAAVFVTGTAVLIALEGLIVAIQIMRLEYYEFFTKFFQGEGTGYEPFRLD
ncbi:MAG: V-type ATP synthase subunit I [Planctomycetota bacterium]|jgi:V/A-type H+-transporting ATPase subunit I